MNTARVQLTDICKKFRATIALHDAALTIPPGSVHCLLGENGAGKSTLVKILSGVMPADSGTMLLDGAPYAPQSPLDARQAGIMMIHQELSIVPDLSVTENIFLGIEESRGGLINSDSMRQQARQALAALGHDDIAADICAANLSVSQRQVVEIARALVRQTKVIIFDEPTSSLSGEDTARLFEVINRLKQQGPAIIYISHFLEEVFQVGDTYSVLRDGAVVASGAMRDTSPEGLAGLLRGDAQITRTSNSSAPKPFGEPLLEIDGLSVPPRIHTATLRVRRGEIIGIAGLIGSGRSELLRSIIGLEQITSGTIRTALCAGPQTTSERWRSGVGFSSEDRAAESLALDLSIAHNLLLSVLATLPLHHHLSESAAIKRCTDITERFNIRCHSLSQPVRELSGGNQQKIALARLALHDAELLLLDEPTRGIDIRSKAQIYELLRRLIAEPTSAAKQRAALIVSSSFSELLTVCDSVAVLHRGILGPPIPVSELSEHRLILMASGSSSLPEHVAV